jgi:hypothetical protein
MDTIRFMNKRVVNPCANIGIGYISLFFTPYITFIHIQNYRIVFTGE